MFYVCRGSRLRDESYFPLGATRRRITTILQKTLNDRDEPLMLGGKCLYVGQVECAGVPVVGALWDECRGAKYWYIPAASFDEALAYVHAVLKQNTARLWPNTT